MDELLERALQSAKARQYKIHKKDSYSKGHQVKCENQMEIMDVTVAALEKQIPMKPIYVQGNGEMWETHWECSECESVVGIAGIAKDTYCSRCGQKILWEGRTNDE